MDSFCAIFGEGVFETILVHKRRVFRLKEHIDRLLAGAKALHLKIPWDKEALAEMILGKARESGLEDIYLRVSLKPEATPVIIAKEITPYPEDLYLCGVGAGFVPTRRIHPEVQSPRIKSGDFLTNILARIEAGQRGLFEGLMCDRRGFLAEGTISNMFIVQNGGLKTPPTPNILKGITRDVVIELARRLDVEAHEEMLTRYDAYIGEEAFLTYTSAGIVPVVEIDGRTIGDGTPGPVTKKLMERYKEILQEESIPI